MFVTVTAGTCGLSAEGRSQYEEAASFAREGACDKDINRVLAGEAGTGAMAGDVRVVVNVAGAGAAGLGEQWGVEQLSHSPIIASRIHACVSVA